MAALNLYKKLIVKLKAIQTDEDLQEYIKKVELKIKYIEKEPYTVSKDVFDWFVRFIRIRSENKKLIAENDLLKERIKQLNKS